MEYIVGGLQEWQASLDWNQIKQRIHHDFIACFGANVENIVIIPIRRLAKNNIIPQIHLHFMKIP